MKICSVLNCKSGAVAKSRISGDAYCNEHALKIMAMGGPESLVTMSNASFPWKYPVSGQCPNCGINYNEYLIGLGGECPSCRKDLSQYKGKK